MNYNTNWLRINCQYHERQVAKGPKKKHLTRVLIVFKTKIHPFNMQKQYSNEVLEIADLESNETNSGVTPNILSLKTESQFVDVSPLMLLSQVIHKVPKITE